MRRKSTRNTSKSTPDKPAKELDSPQKTRRSRRRKRSPSKSSESEEEVLTVTKRLPPEDTPDTTTKSHTPTDEEASEEPMWKVTPQEGSPKGEIQKLKICLTRPSPDSAEKKTRRSKSNSQTEDDAASSEERPARRTRSQGSPLVRSDGLSSQEADEEAEDKKGKGKSKGKHKSKIEKSPHLSDSQLETNNEISENVQVTPQSPSIDKPVHNENDHKVDVDDKQNVNENIQGHETTEESAIAQNTDNKQVQSSKNNSRNVESDDDEPLSAIQKTASENKVVEEQEPEITQTKNQDLAQTQQENTKSSEHKHEQNIKPEIQCSVQLEEDKTQEEQEAVKEIKESLPENCKIKDADDQNSTEEKVSENLPPEQTEPAPEKPPENTLEQPEKSQENTPEQAEPPSEKRSENILEQSELTLEKPSENTSEQSESVPEESCKITQSESTPEKSSKITRDEPVETAFEESSKMAVDEPMETGPSEVEKEQIEAENVVEMEQPKSSIKNKQKIASEERLETSSVEEKESASSVEEKVSGSSAEESQKERTPRLKLNRNKEYIVESEPKEQDQSEEHVPLKPLKTKRKWISDSSQTSLIKLDLESIQNVWPTIDFPEEPDLKVEVEKERRKSVTDLSAKKLDRKVSVEYKSDSERPSFEKQTSVNSVNNDSEDSSNIIAFNRKISIVDDTASKLKPPPSPAKNPVSNILYITNLVRPFTVKQLRELLERTGKIIEDGFWTDRIKSKCYVQYETQEEAEATRTALHGVQWPIGNGKMLIIDYATEEDMQNAKNPPAPPPPVTIPEAKLTTKENLEPAENKTKSEDGVKEAEKKRSEGPVREWDIGKKDVRRDRSRSRDRGRKHRRSPSPSDDFISRKQRKAEESVPQKLMDDLFLKTKATPSIYWQPLSPEEIQMKQQQRLIRMEEHKRRMEESSRMKGRDMGRGAFRRRYD